MKLILLFLASQCLVVLMIALLGLHVNHGYPKENKCRKIRSIFLDTVHIASPAIISGHRNIAFETGSTITNMPAGYITSGSCCEYDESLARRQVFTSLRASVVKGEAQP